LLFINSLDITTAAAFLKSSLSGRQSIITYHFSSSIQNPAVISNPDKELSAYHKP